jgi:hypothetical protein
MDWMDDFMRNMDKMVDRAIRQVATGSHPPGTKVQSVVSSGGNGGYDIMQFTANGRRVFKGPGYIVVGSEYWLTHSRRLTVDSSGAVYADLAPLVAGHPVPDYRPGGALVVRLAGGRLSINDHPIPGYVPPPGTTGCRVEQIGNG